MPTASTPPAHSTGRTAGPDPGWLKVVAGAVSFVVGLLVLVLPDRTLVLVGVLVGIQLVLLGALRLMTVRALTPEGRTRAIGYVLGVLTVAAGIVCMLRPGESLVVVAVFVGIGWMADGVIEVVASARGTTADRGYALFSGVLSVLAGLAVVIFPGTSLRILAQVVGFALLVVGAVYVWTGLRQRRGHARPTT